MDFEQPTSRSFNWQPFLPVLFLLTICVSVGLSYGLFHLQLASIKQQQQQLQTSLSSVNEGEAAALVTAEQVQTQLMQIQERLLNEIQINRVNDKLLTQQIDNLNKLNDKLMLDIKAVTQHDGAVTTQIEKTHAVINDVLKIVEEKAQAMAHIVPAGTVAAYAGEVNDETRKQLVQAGWLVCDGTDYPAESYSALFDAIGNTYGGDRKKGTFNVPDFRGVFLRGLDQGRKMDPKRRLGQYQGDDNRGHLHSADVGSTGEHVHSARTALDGSHRHRLNAQGYWYTTKDKLERRSITEDVNDFQEYWTTENGAHRHEITVEAAGTHRHTVKIGESGGAESRPKNYPVVYLIRF